MKKSNILAGTLLIVVGILVLLDRLGILYLELGRTWPIILVLAGLLFHLGFILGGARSPGLLVPGGILTTYGLLFLFCSFFGWYSMNIYWPVFILGPAVGLFELFLFGDRDKGLLVPVLVLSVLGGGFLMRNLFSIGFEIVLPAGLIVAGILVITGGAVRRRQVPPYYHTGNQPPPQFVRDQPPAGNAQNPGTWQTQGNGQAGGNEQTGGDNHGQ